MGSVSVIDTAKTTAVVSVTQNSVISLTTGESKPGGVIDTDKHSAVLLSPPSQNLAVSSTPTESNWNLQKLNGVVGLAKSSTEMDTN